MKQEQDKSAKKRDKRLLGLAGGIFMLAACVSGGLYSQKQAAQSQADVAQPQSRVSADMSPEMKAQFIEHAKMLREKWEPWAQAHKDQLKRMLNAPATDEAAMLAVWDAVPANSDKVGLTPDVLMPSGNPMVGVGFGWSALEKALATAPMPKRAEDAAVMRKFADAQLPDLRRDFQTRRDISIAMGGVRTDTQLWASGRITQRETRTVDEYVQVTLQARREGRSMTEDDYWTPAQEVVPPYDFLTSS